MKSLLTVGVALGLAALPFAGCDESLTCTAAGCGATLDVLVSVDGGGELPESTYEIVLELDGTPYSAVCSNAGQGLTCEDVEGPNDFEVEARPFTDGTKLWFAVISDGGSGDGPEVVHLTVVAGDAPLVDTTVQPMYAETFPNGEDCSPRCVQADSIDVTFARP